MQTETVSNSVQYLALKKGQGKIADYLSVIKPRETGLLVFIGTVTALVPVGGHISAARILFILAAILVASAGANGLTNYLDRRLDARMERTRHRVLPSGRIFPAERALIFTASLTVIGLVLAWFLHPLAFFADLAGTLAAVIYRKKVTCVFPQGVIASCAPLLMGWFAVTSAFNWEIVLMCVLISLWLPSHIWSIMTARSDDYRNAGLNYFPINSNPRSISRILFGFCLLLWLTSMGLYFTGSFGHLYLIVAAVSGLIITWASWQLMVSNDSKEAWKLYKMSAFPYLGILFLAIGLDIWLHF